MTVQAEELQKPTKEQLRRIRFSEGETGWAFKLPDGTYQINNLPLSDGLNIDDIVECVEEDDNLPIVTKVIKKGLAHKSAVSYQTVQQFHDFCKVARDRGAKTEGLVGPSPGKDGVVIVAHTKDFDPFQEARNLGITDPDKFHREEKK